MRHSVCYLSVIIILASCATIPIEDVNYIPDYNEAAVQMIIDLTNNNEPFLSLQDISTLKRKYEDFSSKEYAALFKAANNKLEELFYEAVTALDYVRALSIYRSVKISGISDRFKPWNEASILRAKAEKEIKNNNRISALVTFQQSLDYEIPDQDEIIKYADIALEEKNRSSLKKICTIMSDENIPVPEEYNEFLDKISTPVDMMKGTVTIWVNRGIKIENGVGYPDRIIGSGFFIDKRGYLITNYHVIASEVDPKYEGYSRLYIRLSESIEEKIPARVIGWDRIFDVALLKVDINPEYVFSFCDEKEYFPGEPIYAIGSPGGLENTITSGIISANRRRLLQIGDTMQVDVPINFGNSGGPLIDKDGNMIGLVFAGLEQFEGINFAIPSYWLIDLIPDLFEGGENTHSWLGMAVYENIKGLEVTYTVPGEPASRAGLLAGDMLKSINGVEILSLRGAQKILLDIEKDTLVKISWQRGDKKYSGILSLRERPFSPIEFALKKDIRDNLIIPLFGMDLEKLKTNLWESSYLVKKVYTGSIADETGLSVNDPIIIKNWHVDEENRIAFLQIRVKKRKSGFLESSVQLAAYLEVDSFL